MRAVRVLVAVLLGLVVAEFVRLEVRHTTEPILEPHCLTVRIHHWHPDRLVRRVNTCTPQDTIVERSTRRS